MSRCVKIPLENSDLFVWEVGDKTITYEIRDKNTGTKMEDSKVSKYEIKADRAYFDSRFISVPVLRYCGQVTGTFVVPL